MRAIAVGIGVLAVVSHQAWWSLVFVAFAVAMAVLEQPEARRRVVVGVALAIGGSAGLVFLGLFLQSLGSIGDGYGCRPDPCPELMPYLRDGGTAISITGLVGIAGIAWFLLRPGRRRLALPALGILFFVLFGAAVALGAGWGNAIVEIAAISAAIGALTLAADRPRLLRAAVAAQVVDLGTFGTVWQLGEGELNPLGRLMMETLFAGHVVNGAWAWEAAAVTGLMMILAKLGLIGFLVAVAPHLGRYARPVLLVATGVGTIGAASNLVVVLT